MAKRNVRIVLGFVAFLVAVVVLLKISGYKPPPAQDASAAPIDSILDDKDFLAKNPGYPSAVAALIRTAGYECPALSQLWIGGESPYGPRLEALCGPDDGKRNSYSALHYAVYPKNFKVNVCAEYKLFGGDDCV